MEPLQVLDYSPARKRHRAPPLRGMVSLGMGVAACAIGVVSNLETFAARGFLLAPLLLLGVCGIVSGAWEWRRSRNRVAVFGVGFSILGTFMSLMLIAFRVFLMTF